MEQTGSNKRAYQFTPHELRMGPTQCVIYLGAVVAFLRRATSGRPHAVRPTRGAENPYPLMRG